MKTMLLLETGRERILKIMGSQTTQLPEGCPPLNSYYFYLTGGCNLACKHCWLAPNFQTNGGTGGHLAYELFVLALDEGVPLGLKRVKLTGGEPLLHPDFTRMIALLKQKTIRFNIETNGTLLTKSLARYLKDSGMMMHISVSLDGAEPETHDAFRGVRGSFERACQGIRYLTDVGYRPQVIMSLHAGNLDEIEALVRLAERLGAGSVKFNLIQPSGRGGRMREQGQTPDIRRLIELGKWIEGTFQQQVSIPLFYSWPLAFYSLNRLIKRVNTCGILGILGILSTGHLAMCGIGVEVPELCYGQLAQDHVFDVWAYHPVLKDLRTKVFENLEGICRECIFVERCLGHCIAQNYFLGKRLTTSHWFCRMADEAGLFPVTRRRSEPVEKFLNT